MIGFFCERDCDVPGRGISRWNIAAFNNTETMVILHGGGVCYRAAIPTAEVVAEKYHVILVAYDGFNPSEPETEFKSVADEAKRLGDYIVENYGGKIDILYGISFGCRILREVLADRRLTITTTIADGMETYDYPDIKSEWAKNICCFFISGFCYLLFGKAGPVRKKLITKAMGRSMEDIDRILYRDASYQSWKNQDYSCFGRHFDFEDFKRTDLYIWHGISSGVEKKLASNIKKWQDAGYVFTYKAFTDVGHGGLAAQQPERFLKEVIRAHEKR